MSRPPLPPPVTDVEDFRRLGVRPQETRLTVIRLAAARGARALAEQQLTRPDPKISVQLSRVATSAYRLLDPRFRRDALQRAHVGRVVPLTWSEQRPGRPNETTVGLCGSQAFASRGLSDQQLIEMLDLDGPPAFEDEVQAYSGRRNRRLRRLARGSAGSLRLLGDRSAEKESLPHWLKRRWVESGRTTRWMSLVILGLIIGTGLGWWNLQPRHENSVVVDAALADPILSAAEIADAALLESISIDDLATFEVATGLEREHETPISPDGLSNTALVSNSALDRRATVDGRDLASAELVPLPSIPSLLQRLDEVIERAGDLKRGGDQPLDNHLRQGDDEGFLADPFARLASRRPPTSPLSEPLIEVPRSEATGDSVDHQSPAIATVAMDIVEETTSSEMQGRLLVDGQDLGVRLQYREGVLIGRPLFEQLSGHLKKDLDQSQIRLVAVFDLDESGEVLVRLATSPEQRQQSVQIDDQEIVFPALRSTCEVQLAAGRHVLQWTFGNEQGPAVSLRLRDSISRKPIPLSPVAAEANDVPTWLTVKIAP